MTADDAVDALVSTLGRLWPEAREVRLDTGRRAARAGSDDFVVIPNARAARLLVPAGNPRAAAAAMRRFSAGLSVREAGQRLGASAALRIAGPVAFPDRITLEGDGDSISKYLQSVLGCDLVVSVGVGPPRANRKPVLEVFDVHGSSLAFVKVGDNAVGRRNVQGEAQALRQVAGMLGPLFEVPLVLHTGTWRDCFVLVMTSLRTSVRQRPKDQWNIPDASMRALSESFATPASKLTDTPLWERMDTAVNSLVDRDLRSGLRKALGRLAQRASNKPMEMGAWHGDWTPWNMARRGGQIQLWDWERFETGVPVGLDALHYGVNAMTRTRGGTPGAVNAGLALAQAEQNPALTGVYLAAISCRYAMSSEDELGHLVSSRAWLMKGVLDDWVERM